MKSKGLTAAQIDCLAQRLSKTPIESATSVKKAGDNFARLLAARIGAERAALAFTLIMTADTADQAEARLILVLDYGNTDPVGEPISLEDELPKAAISDRQTPSHPRSCANRRTSGGAGFIQTDPRPISRQVGADHGLG